MEEHDYEDEQYIRKFGRWLKSHGHPDFDALTDDARHRLEGRFRHSLIRIYGTCDVTEIDLLT